MFVCLSLCSLFATVVCNSQLVLTTCESDVCVGQSATHSHRISCCSSDRSQQQLVSSSTNNNNNNRSCQQTTTTAIDLVVCAYSYFQPAHSRSPLFRRVHLFLNSVGGWVSRARLSPDCHQTLLLSEPQLTHLCCQVDSHKLLATTSKCIVPPITLAQAQAMCHVSFKSDDALVTATVTDTHIDTVAVTLTTGELASVCVCV